MKLGGFVVEVARRGMDGWKDVFVERNFRRYLEVNRRFYGIQDVVRAIRPLIYASAS